MCSEVPYGTRPTRWGLSCRRSTLAWTAGRVPVCFAHGTGWWLFSVERFTGPPLLLLFHRLRTRRREGTGQRESKAQPAQASTKHQHHPKPKPSEPQPQEGHTLTPREENITEQEQGNRPKETKGQGNRRNRRCWWLLGARSVRGAWARPWCSTEARRYEAERDQALTVQMRFRSQLPSALKPPWQPRARAFPG